MLECAKCKPMGSVLLVWKRGQCYLKLSHDTWAGPPQALRYRGCLSSGGGKSRSAGGAGGDRAGGGLGAGGGWGPSRETAGCRPERVERSFSVEPDGGAVPAGGQAAQVPEDREGRMRRGLRGSFWRVRVRAGQGKESRTSLPCPRAPARGQVQEADSGPDTQGYRKAEAWGGLLPP